MFESKRRIFTQIGWGSFLAVALFMILDNFLGITAPENLLYSIAVISFVVFSVATVAISFIHGNSVDEVKYALPAPVTAIVGGIVFPLIFLCILSSAFMYAPLKTSFDHDRVWVQYEVDRPENAREIHSLVFYNPVREEIATYRLSGSVRNNGIWLSYVYAGTGLDFHRQYVEDPAHFADWSNKAIISYMNALALSRRNITVLEYVDALQHTLGKVALPQGTVWTGRYGILPETQLFDTVQVADVL